MADIKKDCIACKQPFAFDDIVVPAQRVYVVKDSRAEITEFRQSFAHLHCPELPKALPIFGKVSQRGIPSDEWERVPIGIIKFEPGYEPPVVSMACPSCGIIASRKASNWSWQSSGGFRAGFSCAPRDEPARISNCYRTWDLVVEAPVR